MTDATPPEFVYRIIAAPDWAEAKKTGLVAYGELDRRDGFLHLSTRAQTLETAALYFKGQKDLFALEIPLAAIADAVKFEPAAARDGEKFPHLYGQLATGDVACAIRLLDDENGRCRFGEEAP